MIKFFKNKFFISLFVLVITVIITSSCYATVYVNTLSSETVEAPFTSNDVYSAVPSFNFNSDNCKIFVARWTGDSPSNPLYYITIISNDLDFSYLKPTSNNDSESRPYNSSNTIINAKYVKFYYRADKGFCQMSGSQYVPVNITSYSTGSYIRVGQNISSADSSNYRICSISDVPLYTLNGTQVYEPYTGISTSFDYVLSGVDYDTIRVDISNLDSSLKMFGYYNINNSYEVGDTLNLNSMNSNIRLLSSRIDNSDLWCNINLGEVITYYIVDSDYTILAIGEFNQMAVGDFLYGFNVKNRDAVDFVFVRNGSVYWNNNLNFYYKDSHGDFFINQNSVVSSNEYSFIYNGSFYNSGTYSAKVCDSNDNILASTELFYQSDWSSDVSLTVNSSYYETHVGWNKSCFCISSLSLFGKDISGSDINFTDYKVRWSIPQNVVVDSLEVGSDSYSKRSGTLTCSNSNGLISPVNVKVYVLIRDYVPFDFTFEVYDSNDNLVLTQKLNSDSIVSNKISSNANDVSQPNYDIVNNPNYSGSSNSTSSGNSFDSISNWSVEDYSNLMNTNNTIWQFFKAILGNLPWWITTPLFILILGVVIISLIRFARGA